MPVSDEGNSMGVLGARLDWSRISIEFCRDGSKEKRLVLLQLSSALSEASGAEDAVLLQASWVVEFVVC